MTNKRALKELDVLAGLDACYLLIRELLSAQGIPYDFGLPGQVSGSMSHFEVTVTPVKEHKWLSVGSIEGIALQQYRSLVRISTEGQMSPYQQILIANSIPEDQREGIERFFSEGMLTMQKIVIAIEERMRELDLLRP